MTMLATLRSLRLSYVENVEASARPIDKSNTRPDTTLLSLLKDSGEAPSDTSLPNPL
jgi:hypothetical protein